MLKPPLIELTRVAITRGKTKVLKDINWIVRPGENWFIMGNNGSGKTTLLEIILGYLWPQQGSVRVLGETYGDCAIPEIRKAVGYVAPWVFSRLPPEVPVADVVASGYDASIGWVSRRTAGINKNVRRALRLSDALSLIRRPFGQLSSGQQFKVVLARALVHDPKILILDEPFSLLDIGARMQMYRILERLACRRGGPGMILVTHHLDDITPVFTHGLILRNGRIFFQGQRRRGLNPRVLRAAFGLSSGSKFR